MKGWIVYVLVISKTNDITLQNANDFKLLSENKLHITEKELPLTSVLKKIEKLPISYGKSALQYEVFAN